MASVLLALGAALLLSIRLDAPALFDNEGRYAEVAREMVLTGDWVTPRLDGTLFLNKPPLVYWLVALVYRVAGPSEWGRLVSVIAAAAALLATIRLGALLYDERVGLVAGVMLATAIGFVLEARTLRPDMLIVADVVLALYCWRRALVADRRTGWLLALYATLGIGVLAKGLVPILLVAAPIGVVTLMDEGWVGLGRLRPGLGLAVIASLVLPWHVAVARAHPGFAWDYVVNQHLLFFLDRKLPRDSEGDPVLFFWSAFLGRAAPWIVLAPLTLPEAVRGMRAPLGDPARASCLLWVWAAGVLGLFSCAPSRLEHYSLPALPAAALLAARTWQRAGAGGLGGVAWRWLMAVGVLLAVAGGVLLGAGPGLFARSYWIAQVSGLTPLDPLAPLILAAGAVLLAGGVAVALAALRRHATLVVAALAAVVVPFAAIVVRAEIAVEPLFSWRPVAQAIRALPPATAVVFEAPVEYQQVGGLAFYAGRAIELLEPPGFVPPTYLVPVFAHMFVTRSELARRWASSERLAFVSDPQQRRDQADGLVPQPFHVLARFGDRWVLTNFPAR